MTTAHATAQADGPATATTTPVVQTHTLTKRFGDTVALDGLDLRIMPGTVFGYLGPNGSGKTTTLRLLLGLLHPTSGRATVLGHDVADDLLAVLGQIGYLPSDFVAPPRLTPLTYLRYLAELRGGVDEQRVRDLADRLALPLDRRIGALSHGNRQKVGLIQAFMHRPALVVLDEPSAGLDPLVQREFLALIREVRAAGRSVLLSSHIMSEVDAVADVIGILRRGRLVAVQDVESVRSGATRRVRLTFAGAAPASQLSALPEVRDIEALDGHLTVTVEGSMARFWRQAAEHDVVDAQIPEADLEEMFLHYYRDEVAP